MERFCVCVSGWEKAEREREFKLSQLMYPCYKIIMVWFYELLRLPGTEKEGQMRTKYPSILFLRDVAIFLKWKMPEWAIICLMPCFGNVAFNFLCCEFQYFLIFTRTLVGNLKILHIGFGSAICSSTSKKTKKNKKQLQWLKQIQPNFSPITRNPDFCSYRQLFNCWMI